VGAVQELAKALGRSQGIVEKKSPWRDPRDVLNFLNGILWVLCTRAPWADLPRRYPPPQTCHRRFQKWVKEGVLKAVLRGLAEDLRARGKVDLTEAYVDGSHAGAKRGALWLDELDAAKRPRSWQWQTALAFLSPLGLQDCKWSAK
jgi:transposase